MTIKLHYKSILIPLQQILWTCCIFLSSINNTFFSMLVIIFSNMSYFCFDYTNTSSIHAMSYCSVVLRIIFLLCIKNYFLQYCEFIFGPTMLCGPCSWSGLVFDFPFWKLCKCRSAIKENAKVKHCQGKNRRGFHLSYKICQEPVVCALVMRFSWLKI